LQTNGGYQLYVDHRPFTLKAPVSVLATKRLAECGRQFVPHLADGWRALLRPANPGFCSHERLYVTMGLEIGRERRGFDYNDPAAVARSCNGSKAKS